ncbi:tyrosine-protein phosphatase [Kribbella capetownensis]|uniref:tyrosine-protein phosphatase n=1 Tax=Kribbella capetownensis TaxID=1572659 RepID=UPI001EDD451D|nr:tyrosine-protein phosphatase [Kribbella capetownensis]
MLDWPNCTNVRDLGGLPLTDGGRIRAGALVRSDNLDQLTDAGVAAVRAAGVSRIVDLRSVWECETFPSPFTHDDRWLNVPLTDPADPDVSTSELFEQYRILIDDYPDRFASAITAIAEAPPGGVVLTCHAGKDRTGLVTALTLALIGVPRDAIAADYAITNLTESRPGFDLPTAETILRVLAHLDTKYGGPVAYVIQAGATTTHLTSLTTRLGQADRQG